MEETEITFDNPFLNLKKSELDFLNVRKLISYFPTSLRVNALTSNELLEFLQSELENKDLTIDELRAQLEALVNQGVGTTDSIDTTIETLIDSIGSQIESLDISGQVNSANLEIALQGYTQIGESGVYYKANGLGNAGAEFYLLSEGEFGIFNDLATFGDGEGIRAPIEMEFINTNKFITRVKKSEGRWKASYGDRTANLDVDIFKMRDVAAGFFAVNADLNEIGFTLEPLVAGKPPKKYKFNVNPGVLNEFGLENVGLKRNADFDSSWSTTITFRVESTDISNPINGQLTFSGKVERKII